MNFYSTRDAAIELDKAQRELREMNRDLILGHSYSEKHQTAINEAAYRVRDAVRFLCSEQADD